MNASLVMPTWNAGPLLELSSFPRSALTIHSATSNQAHVFRVWIADTPERQSQGLMFVQDLPADEGQETTVVSDVMRPGYAWQGRVIRPAMVKVKG